MSIAQFRTLLKTNTIERAIKMKHLCPNHVNSSEKPFKWNLKDVNKSSAKIKEIKNGKWALKRSDEFPQLFGKITRGNCEKNV